MPRSLSARSGTGAARDKQRGTGKDLRLNSQQSATSRGGPLVQDYNSVYARVESRRSRSTKSTRQHSRNAGLVLEMARLNIRKELSALVGCQVASEP
jgi:hypothetical protein